MDSVVKKLGFMWKKSGQVANPSKSNNPVMPRPCPNPSSPKANRLSIRHRRRSKHRAFCSNPEKSALTHRLSIKSALCASAAGIVSYQFSSLSNHTRHTQQAEYGNGGANSLGRYEYIWLPTDSGDAIPIGLYKSGKFFAVHSDHLGTPRLITDESNTPVWQWPYSAFGESSPTGVLAYTNVGSLIYTQDPTSLNRLKLTTPGVVYNLRHAGQYADAETGFFYNYFRTYDPKTGRYSQNDPIGLGGGLNRFGYVGGNALRFTDPFGLCPCGNPVDLLGLARSDKRDWSKAADRSDVNGGFGSNTYKCNLYADTQYEDAGYNLPNIGGGLFSRTLGKYPPGAGELSKPDYKVPGWSAVSGPAQPGDLVASGGHVGIATSSGTTISASPGGVVENNWGFRPGQQSVIRRCSCSN